MSNLIQIKQRIKAIEKTKKITRAMRLIAMSLYSKLELQKEHLHTYFSRCTHTLKTALEQGARLPKHLAGEDIADTHPLIIVCSSTKSLCGSLNSNILRYFEQTLEIEDRQKPSFIALGAKAKEVLSKRYGSRVIFSDTELTVDTLTNIATQIMHLLLAEERVFTSVTLYYTQLKSFFLQEAAKVHLVPFPDLTADSGAHPTRKTEATEAHDYILEQEPQVLGTAIAESYLYSSLLHHLFQSIISENAARFISMDQSTNNADSYLEVLSLQYNKSRQNQITREIAELASNLDS